MKHTTERAERVISERWPELKQRALHEQDVEKLIPILEEIENFLVALESIVTAAKGGEEFSDFGADARSDGYFEHAAPEDNEEIGSQ